MACYEGFAHLYDRFMTDIPYDEWAGYIDQILKNCLPAKPLVLDLACGTGNMTIRLAQRGYDMIGVDASSHMLAEAQAKTDVLESPILFLAQDMRELDLYGTVDATVCVCDALNYILLDEELKAVFERIALFLNPGGIFIFDMNTEYKFKEKLGNQSFTATSQGTTYIWDNHYDPHTCINEYHMVFYTHDEKGEPFTELHYQRAYSNDHVINTLQEAGFNNIQIYDGYSDNPPATDGVRVTYIASKA